MLGENGIPFHRECTELSFRFEKVYKTTSPCSTILPVPMCFAPVYGEKLTRSFFVWDDPTSGVSTRILTVTVSSEQQHSCKLGLEILVLKSCYSAPNCIV